MLSSRKAGGSSHHGHRLTNVSAFIGGLFCIVGTVVIVVLSASKGWDYWTHQQNPLNAWLSLGFELVAAGGIAASMMHAGAHKWKIRVAAWVVVAMTAGWCGYTQYEAMQADAVQQARTLVSQTPTYRSADEALANARTAYNDALQTRAPTCSCPLTIAAWNSEAAIAARTADRDEKYNAMRRAERDLQALIPVPALDAMLIFRGVTIELVKLFGLPLFGVGLGAFVRLSRPLDLQTIADDNVVDLETERSKRSSRNAPTGTDLQRARQLRADGLSLRKIGEQFNVSHTTIGRWLKTG